MHTHNPARARTLAPGSVENIVSGSTHLFFFFFFELWWVLAGVGRLTSCSEPGLLSSCGAQTSHCGGFSCGGALECWPSSCGTQALVARGM